MPPKIQVNDLLDRLKSNGSSNRDFIPIPMADDDHHQNYGQITWFKSLATLHAVIEIVTLSKKYCNIIILGSCHFFLRDHTAAGQ